MNMETERLMQEFRKSFHVRLAKKRGYDVKKEDIDISKSDDRIQEKIVPFDFEKFFASLFHKDNS